jgi:ATP:ADP antiporter, AAA family
MLVAGLMLAHQVAGKAARDAFFLSEFNATYFPMMVMAGSAISIAGGLLNSRVLQVLTPARMVSWTFIASGVLHFIEWLLISGPYRPVVVVLIYIHIVGLGAIVLSNFWSLLNERFDPHSGKQYFGRIAGFGTFGGILGGLAAERSAVVLPPNSILLFLSGLHLLCAGVSFLVVYRSRNIAPVVNHQHENEERLTSAAWSVFRGSPYLKKLATLVLLGTTTAALLDIIFKTQAAALIGRGPSLLRFFAIFYTVAQILSFGVQLLVTRKWLEKQGLARGIGSLPTVVAVGGLGALIFPSFVVLVVTRALEIILRGSIYRAGYELLYTPVPVQEKRAAKPVADVVFDRLGDVLGGGASQIFLALGGAFAVKGVLLVAVGIAGVSLFVTRQLGRLYVRVLEKGLVERAIELNVSTSQELMTGSVLLRTLSIRRGSTPDVPAPPEQEIQPRQPTLSDPIFQVLADLRSGKVEVVRGTLTSIHQMDPLLVPQVIVLLAWDEIVPNVLRVLRINVGRIGGQLLDSLLDENTDFAIRRRIPRALAYSDDPRTVQGLMGGLRDSRFEVRFQSARALDVILQRNPSYRPDRDSVVATIEREMSISRGMWGSRRLLDRRQSTDEFQFLDDVLRERANLSWEYLFTVLALILPREPLKVAFQALHTEDRLLRGLALEYLDSVLPQSLKGLQKLWETPADVVPAAVPRSAAPEEAAARLLNAQQEVAVNLTNMALPLVDEGG